MGLNMKYFILKPRADSRDDPYARASQEAMLQYAMSIWDKNVELAKDLNAWAIIEEVKQNNMKE